MEPRKPKVWIPIKLQLTRPVAARLTARVATSGGKHARSPTHRLLISEARELRCRRNAQAKHNPGYLKIPDRGWVNA